MEIELKVILSSVKICFKWQTISHDFFHLLIDFTSRILWWSFNLICEDIIFLLFFFFNMMVIKKLNNLMDFVELLEYFIRFNLIHHFIGLWNELMKFVLVLLWNIKVMDIIMTKKSWVVFESSHQFFFVLDFVLFANYFSQLVKKSNNESRSKET